MSLNGGVDLAGYRHVGTNEPNSARKVVADAVGAAGTSMHLSLSPTGDLIVEVHALVEVGGSPTVVNIQEIIMKCVTSQEVRQQVEKFDLRYTAPTNVRVLCTNFVNEMDKMIRFTENPNGRDDKQKNKDEIKALTCDVPYALPGGRTEMKGTPLWSIRCGCQRVVPIGQNTMTEECRQYCCLSPSSMRVGPGSGASYRDDGHRSVLIEPDTIPFAVVSYVIKNGQIPELSINISDHVKDGMLVTSAPTYEAICAAFESKLKLVNRNTYDMRQAQVMVDYCPGYPNPELKEPERGYVTIEFTIESAIRDDPRGSDVFGQRAARAYPASRGPDTGISDGEGGSDDE